MARTKEGPSRATLMSHSKTETWYLWLLESWPPRMMTGSYSEFGDLAFVQTQNLSMTVVTRPPVTLWINSFKCGKRSLIILNYRPFSVTSPWSSLDLHMPPTQASLPGIGDGTQASLWFSLLSPNYSFVIGEWAL